MKFERAHLKFSTEFNTDGIALFGNDFLCTPDKLDDCRYYRDARPDEEHNEHAPYRGHCHRRCPLINDILRTLLAYALLLPPALLQSIPIGHCISAVETFEYIIRFSSGTGGTPQRLYANSSLESMFRNIYCELGSLNPTLSTWRSPFSCNRRMACDSIVLYGDPGGVAMP